MGSIIEADHATGNWIFSKEEIEKNTPSRKDGIDAKKEAWLRKGCCTFIQDAGMRLKVPQLTIATAIMFCHRFFMRQSYAEQDRYVIASTCLFLAGKVEDTPRQLKDVIYITYIIRHKKDKAAEDRIKQSREVFEHERELLLAGEYLVMNTLSFDLNINHPYKPLLSTIRKFDKEGPLKHLAQVSWNFVNDGLRTSLGLQFRPHEVAAGAIYLAAKFLKISLPQQDGKPWWTEFQVTPNILEDVSSQMLELYEQTKDGSGTTGASSRRHSKSHGPAKSAGGAKSKGGHPTTPSVADRAAQASLTSGASVPPSAAPLPPAAGGAKETELGPAERAAVGAPAVVPAGRKPEPGRDKEPGTQAGAAPPLRENGHVAAASATVVGAPGAAAPTEGGKPGADGQDSAPGAQVAASAVKGPEVAVIPEAVHHETFASKSSGAMVEANGGTSMSSLGANGAREVAQAGSLADAGGKALDEPMDVDEGPAAPSTAAEDSGRLVQSHAQGASPGRDRPGPLPETGAPRSAGGEAAAGPGAEARDSREQGERAGMAAPQQEGGRPGHAGAHGLADRGGGETELVVGATSERQAPTVPASQALERVSEEGEIPSEEGEIPSSPAAHEVRSPANASRERERDGRVRSRSRSHSRDHSQSPPSPRRRRADYHSRSKSPSEPARGRSPSPYSSGGKRHKNGQRRRDWDKVRGGGGHPPRDAGDRGHWNRDRDRDRGRDRDRDRNRERDRERQGAHRSHKDAGRHRGLQYTDSADRRR